MKRKIIGICGLIGSGKNTVGQFLVDSYGFQRISYGDRLKDSVSATFGWDRKMLEGDTPASREWRNQPDEFWSHELGFPVTPRYVLQVFGTECVRNGFHNDTWVLLVKKEILERSSEDFVVPDVRFKNEKKLITDLGGEIWQVWNQERPEWTTSAISDNRYGTTFMNTDYPEIHESEYRWINYDECFDYTIENTGTLDELKQKVKNRMDR